MAICLDIKYLIKDLNVTLKIIGHRGNGTTFNSPFAEGKAPENTIQSIRQAFQAGADGVEIDVFLTQDKIPVIYAKNEIDGCPVNQLTLKDVKNVRLARDVSIPTLKEALVELADITARSRAGEFLINIELKGEGVAEYTQEELEPFLADGSLSSESILFSSFDWDKLSLIRELSPQARIQATIATVHLFEKNVVKMPGYNVCLKQEYNKNAFEGLKSYLAEHECVAVDVPTLDIREEMFNAVRDLKIGFCTHPSGPRKLERAPMLQETISRLYNYSLEVDAPVCLKVDDIAAARSIVEDIKAGRSSDDINALERVCGMHFLP